MTNPPFRDHTSPAPQGDGAPEIEVTAAMKQAGAVELFKLLGACDAPYDYADVAEAVFKIMLDHCSAQSGSSRCQVSM